MRGRATVDELAAPRPSRLRLLDPTPPELPTGEHLVGAPVRRPGELHEVVVLSPAARDRLCDQLSRVDLAPDVAASLLLEAAALESELARLGLRSPRTLLVSAASEVRVTCRQRAAEADYLRELTSARRRRAPRPASASVAVALRLLSRIAGCRLEECFAVVPLECAVSYEVAAVAGARTMSEWGLAAALAAVAIADQ